MREGSFVGVVAQTEWAAIQAAKTLKVTWSTPETKLPANSDAVYDYLKNTKSFRDRPVVNRGNHGAAFSQATKTFEATFRWPFQMHGMIAPSCAVADVQRQTKPPSGRRRRARSTRASKWPMLLGVPENKVRVIYREAVRMLRTAWAPMMPPKMPR